MDNFLAIYAHGAVCYLHVLLAYRFYPERNQNSIVLMFWMMMVLYSLLHFSYTLSFIGQAFEQPQLIQSSLWVGYWLLGLLPPFLFPLFIGELSGQPAYRTPVTAILLGMVNNVNRLFYVALLIVAFTAVIELPRQLPLESWEASAGNEYALYMVFGLGAFWLFLLLMGLRPTADWDPFRRTFRYIMIGLILFYIVTYTTANMDGYWSIIPIVSTVSFSLVFSWYRFRLQFMDMILNQCVGVLLLLAMVVGFSGFVGQPWLPESEGAQLTLVTLYILSAALAYRWLFARARNLWLPSTEALMRIHTELPTALANCVDEASAKSVTAKFLTGVFDCKVGIDENKGTENAELILPGDPGIKLQLGYIRGWIPWLSEALNWARTAGLYLQRHLQSLSALEALQQESIKAERLSSLAARAELNAMRAQIRPHFLFNTLNSIHGFIRDDPDQAEEVLELLADLMRGVLQRSDQDLIPLADELALTRVYLRIEQCRYGDRLNFHIDNDIGLGGIQVPPFSIQPLAENVIKHAVDSRSEPVRLDIVLNHQDQSFCIDVLDDGPGLVDNKSGGIESGTHLGIALRNVEDRLQRLFPEVGTLLLENRSGGGVRARVTIPAPAEHRVQDLT